MTLKELTAEAIQPFVGDTFHVAAAGAEIDLVLKRAARLRVGQDSPRPFSLVFEGPNDLPLEQSTYGFNHPVFGSLDIFIVPVGRTENARQYEAVFN